jgi:hypothetical protein
VQVNDPPTTVTVPSLQVTPMLPKYGVTVSPEVNPEPVRTTSLPTSPLAGANTREGVVAGNRRAPGPFGVRWKVDAGPKANRLIEATTIETNTAATIPRWWRLGRRGQAPVRTPSGTGETVGMPPSGGAMSPLPAPSTTAVLDRAHGSTAAGKERGDRSEIHLVEGDSFPAAGGPVHGP